jgi:hypothetical protein
VKPAFAGSALDNEAERPAHHRLASELDLVEADVQDAKL